MPSLSLLIGGASALTVLIVATIDVSVTLTFSAAAIEAVAQRHTETLVELAERRVAEFVEAPLVACEALQRYHGSVAFTSITADPTNATARTVHQTVNAIFTTAIGPAVNEVGIYYRDGSSSIAQLVGTRGAGVITAAVRGPPANRIDVIGEVYNDNGTFSPQRTATMMAETRAINYSYYWGPSSWAAAVNATLRGPTALSAYLDWPYVWVDDPANPETSARWGFGWQRAARSSNGEMVAILYSGLIMGRLSRELIATGAAAMTNGAHVFVAEQRNGYLLASTHPTPVTNLTVVPAGTPAVPYSNCFSTEFDSTAVFGGPVFLGCRHHLRDFPWAPLRSLLANDAALPHVGAGATLRDLDGGRYYVALRCLSPPDTLNSDLLVLVLVPEKEIVSEMNRGRDIAIGISAAVFVVSVAASFGAVHLLLRPLRDVSERVRAAAELEKDDTPREESGISEVRELQRSYYALSDELERLAAFVPQSVLAARRAAAEDDVFDSSNVVTPHVSISDSMSVAESRESRQSINAARHAGNAANNNARGVAGTSRTTLSHTSSSMIDPSGAPHAISSSPVGGSNRGTGAPPHSAGRGTGSSGRGLASLNVEHGLARRVIAVVYLNCGGFNPLVRRCGRRELQIMYSEFVQAIVNAADANGGVVDSFNGDRVVVSFNAARPAMQHSRRAVTAALQIASAAADDALGLPAYIGVASGRAEVGNLGCPRFMRFVSLGSPLTTAAALAALAPRYAAEHAALPAADEAARGPSGPCGADSVLRVPDGSKVLIATPTRLDVELHFRVRALDYTVVSRPSSALVESAQKELTFVSSPVTAQLGGIGGGGQGTGGSSPRRPWRTARRELVAEAVAPLRTERCDGDWLYVLTSTEGYAENTVFGLIAQGQHARARDALAQIRAAASGATPTATTANDPTATVAPASAPLSLASSAALRRAEAVLDALAQEAPPPATAAEHAAFFGIDADHACPAPHVVSAAEDETSDADYDSPSGSPGMLLGGAFRGGPSTEPARAAPTAPQ